MPARLIFAALCAAGFAYVFSYAWVDEDAFITFRVIDNFVHGYGLRWNIDERVQVFTHPLWMLLHIPFYAAFGHIFRLTIGLSAVIGAGAVYFLLKSPRPLPYRIVLGLLPLILSPSFDTYIISGFETPLTLCLMGWFFHTLIAQPTRLYRLFFIASLCMLTRYDNAVALFPALASLTYTNRKSLKITRALASFLPFLLWCAFSLFYYGFIFPNTKYAKLPADFALGVYVRQGFYYLQEFLFFDIIASLCIIAALITSITQRTRTILILGFGIAASIAYVVAVGGDYMVGRFLVTPFYLSVFLLYHAWPNLPAAKLATIAALTAGLFNFQLNVLSDMEDLSTTTIANHNICDPRQYYLETNTLFSPGQYPREQVSHIRALRGILLRSDDTPGKFVATGNVGMLGYFAGPKVTIIDSLALTDPLLSRMPVKLGRKWTAGHFRRAFPESYVHARRTGDTSHMNSDLRQYYEKLRLITNGDLLDAERLKTIALFQLGVYEQWREDYVKTLEIQQEMQ